MASPRRRLAAAAATPHNTTGNRKGRTPRVPSARAGGRGRAGARGKPEAPRGGGAEGEEETTKERERERGVEREEREGSGRQEERKRGGRDEVRRGIFHQPPGSSVTGPFLAAAKRDVCCGMCLLLEVYTC